MTEATDHSSSGLTPQEAEIFARGLYHVANVDGIEDREKTLIEEFLRESGCALAWDDLTRSAFSPTEAALGLETSFLRQVFIKTAIALVKADGVFSDGERHLLGEIADAFGLSNAEFGDLEQQATHAKLT